MVTSKKIDASAQRKPTVFIGSSSEALPIVNRLVGFLGSDFDVHPWNQSFPPGEYTLTALFQQVERTDAAIFIFAKDDEVTIRGELGHSARGNVLLEYGLFVARLGRERVLILEEEGVNLPSDVFGITTASFPATPGVARNAALAVFAEEDVLPKWRELRPRLRSGDDAMDTNLGYAKTIRQERRNLDEIAGALNEFSASPASTTRSPIRFGSTAAPISTYAEALGRVENDSGLRRSCRPVSGRGLMVRFLPPTRRC